VAGFLQWTFIMRRNSSTSVLGTVRPANHYALAALLGCCAVGFTGQSAHAIEMFTFYGDGSRVGLPSLEVPIEAYPGIPLRSDRLRARRRAQRNPGTPVRVGPPGGITIRAMPEGQPVPPPRGP
jgi:hypothetical protein